MPKLSDLADILSKCRVVSRRLWGEAAAAGGDDLDRILDFLQSNPPSWWDGPPPNPPGLTDYQREAIQTRFADNELQLLRRDLALNQFLLLDKLGHGGQGEVYRSRQLNPPRFAAVKVLLRDTESRRQRFEQEARAMIKIRHPAVARFFLYERIRDALGDPTDEYLIAMEFVNGTDLQRLVRQVGPIPWPFAVHWVSEILAGLEVIHRNGFIHRDVKPENVMIVGPPPGPDVLLDETAAKLLDFGAVNRVGDTTVKTGAPRVFVGTMEYAAPEQWAGEMDVASDLYALGGTLFYMLTGRPCFKKEKRDPHAYMNAHLHEEAPDLQSCNPQAPPDLNRLFHRMMAKNHAERGTASELRAAFLRLRPTESLPADSTPPPLEFDPMRTRSTDVEPEPPTQVNPPHRRAAPAPAPTRPQNPIVGAADRVLAVLEYIFIPAHLRVPPECDVSLAERVLALIRRPLVLIILLVILAIAIICW